MPVTTVGSGLVLDSGSVVVTQGRAVTLRFPGDERNSVIDFIETPDGIMRASQRNGAGTMTLEDATSNPLGVTVQEAEIATFGAERCT